MCHYSLFKSLFVELTSFLQYAYVIVSIVKYRTLVYSLKGLNFSKIWFLVASILRLYRQIYETEMQVEENLCLLSIFFLLKI